MNQPTQEPARSRWSLSLSTVLLVIAAIAVWVAYFDVRAKSERAEVAVKTLKARIRDLEVDDPLQFAVRKRPAKVFGGHEWQVHLPAEKDSYQLNVVISPERQGAKKQSFEEFRESLATEDIGFSCQLKPGRHDVRIDVIEFLDSEEDDNLSPAEFVEKLDQKTVEVYVDQSLRGSFIVQCSFLRTFDMHEHPGQGTVQSPIDSPLVVAFTDVFGQAAIWIEPTSPE